MTPPPAARLRRRAGAVCLGAVAIWCIASATAAQTNHERLKRSSWMNDLNKTASCCLVFDKSYIC